MKKDEVILFKQWDSDRTLPGRLCFHTAFLDPNAPKDTPARESIEVRAIAYFPDHEPNTCPPIQDEIEDIEIDVENIQRSVHGYATKRMGVQRCANICRNMQMQIYDNV